MQRVSDRVEGTDRFVDIGVTLHTVVADPKGEELLPGKPPLRIIATSHHGGIVDTKADPPRIVGPSQDPRIWFCSQEQRVVIMARDKEPAQLVYGSEGAGKSTALAMWHYFRWLENFGHGWEAGQTAPTNERLGAVKGEMVSLYGANWMRWRELIDFTGFEFCDGTRIRFRYTHRRSAAEGEAIQSYNWVWCGRDEMQDSVEAHGGIQARGRSAPGGRYMQLGTATAKDSPEWRTLRDQLEVSGLWIRRTLLGPRSPFVWPAHWESMKGTMPEREYKRRVLAMDLPPETAVYPDWSRETNLITVPDLGWTDVTERELAHIAPNLAMLAGHDPGELWDVSLLGKAYVLNSIDREHPWLATYDAYNRGVARPFWVIRGEVSTQQSTTEAHILDLLKILRENWQLNFLGRNGRPSPDVSQALVYADPAGNTDSKTDKSVYTQFANAGLKIKPAAYSKDQLGHGRVPREPAVELVNTLICNAHGHRRLFVERLPSGKPAAPKLVAALEKSERDLAGRAEASPKGKHDLTHWPAALRYMFWPIERPRLQLVHGRQS